VSEIEFPEKDAEISTLGDPIPPGVRASNYQDPSLADSTLSFDYEFQKQGFRSSASPGTSVDGSNTSALVTEDDATLQEQYISQNHFEVEAPPGMLGMVLENVGVSSVPTVHAVKENSPIASQIKVGDQLLSIDGESVTDMLAPEASRLIASRMQNPVRRFVFARPGAELKDDTREKGPPVFSRTRCCKSHRRLDKTRDLACTDGPFEGGSLESIED
jgi:hypothetical protein